MFKQEHTVVDSLSKRYGALLCGSPAIQSEPANWIRGFTAPVESR
jgi:hypothetical protein